MEQWPPRTGPRPALGRRSGEGGCGDGGGVEVGDGGRDALRLRGGDGEGHSAARARAPPRKGRMKGSWEPAGARKRSPAAGLMGRLKEIPREVEGV